MAKIIKILFFIIISINIKAQLPYGLPPIHNYYTESKYIQNQVWDITQAKDGRIIISTDQYLVSFDGFNFEKLYNSYSNSILSLCLRDDSIFLGTTTNIVEISSGFKKEISQLNINSNIPNVRTILCEGDYTYFFSNKKEILYKHNKNYEYIARPSNFEILRGFKANNKIFGVSLYGIARIKEGKFNIISYKYKDIYEQDIRVFLSYDSTRYLIGTKEGNLYLYQSDSDRFKPFNVTFGDAQNIFYKGTKLSDSLFVLTTLNNGVYVISSKGQIIYHFTKESGLISNAIYSAFVDDLKNLWLGTSSGISYINFSSILYSYDKRTEIDDMTFYSYIYNDNLLVSTPEKLLIYDLKNKNNLNVKKKYNYSYINDYTEIKVKDKKYLVVNGYGKYIIFNDKLEPVYEKECGNINYVRNTGYDSSVFYHIDFQNGFKKAKVTEENGHIKVYEEKIFPSLQFPFRHIYVDKYYDLWLAMGDLLFCVDYKTPKSNPKDFNIILYDNNQIITNSSIKSFFEQNDKLVLFTDSSQFFIKLKPEKEKSDKFEYFDIPHSSDLLKYLVIGGNKYMLKQDKLLIVGKNDSIKDSLILPSVCNINNNTDFIHYKDYLFFNSNNSVFCLHKNLINPLIKEYQTRIVFPYFIQNDKLYQLSRDDVLENNSENKIIIKETIDRKSELKFYFYLTPIRLENYRFYYRLDNSKNWQEFSRNEIEFRHIESGHHILQIKVFNGHYYTYSPNVEFFVKKSVFLTIWAFIIYTLLLALLTFFINRIVTKRIRDRQLYLEKVIESRAQEISEQQSELIAQSELVEHHKLRLESETKKLKLTLFELKQMSLAAQNTEDAILVLDKKGRFEWWNRAFANLFAYKFEKYKDLPQREFQRKIRPDIYRELKNYYDINMGTIHYNSHEIFDNNEEIWYKTKITQIVSEGNIAGYLVIDSNLTDYKILEEALFNQKEINLLLKEKINLLKAENSLIKENANRLKKFDKLNLEYSKYIRDILNTYKMLSELFDKFFVFDKPKDEVSGDFLWSKKIDNFLYIALGDASGHKTRGAIMSSISYIMLNKIVCKSTLNPSQVLEKLNNDLFEFFTRNKISRDTLFLGLIKIDLNSKKIYYSGSRIPIIIVRMKEVSSIYKLDSKHATLGIKPGIKFDDEEVTLSKKDRIYLYTDGWPNQLGALGLKKYSHNRIMYFFQNIQELNFEIHHKLISEEILHWKKNFEQIDDIMVVGIEI